MFSLIFGVSAIFGLASINAAPPTCTSGKCVVESKQVKKVVSVAKHITKNREPLKFFKRSRR